MNEDTKKEHPSKRGGSKKKTYSFELSLPVLIGASALLVVGVIWVFIFGILVGRGYQPEMTLPGLARFMPDTSTNATSKQQPELLKAEELQFHDALKEKSGRAPAPAPAIQDKKPSQPAAQKKTVAKAAPSPTKSSTAKQSTEKRTVVKQTVAKQPKAAQQVSASKKTSDEQRFDYVYQTASFKEKQAAESFKQKIISLGLTPEIEKILHKGADWYRVNVRFKGTPVETRGLKAKLSTIGVEKPLIRSKKPIME
jgi:cell division protein FtsN